MTSTVHIISAGAAKGLVQSLQPEFERATASALVGEFGAVGAMKEKLLAGAPCDVLILTQAMLEALANDGLVEARSIRPLGRVYTGVAVPAESRRPDIASTESLASALRAATAIYFPDPQRATAGIHFAGVLDRLGIRGEVESRLRPYPNGATAMRAMADSGDPRAIGCTQATEILYTPGVELVGVLPKDFELSTVYSVAVCTRAAHADAARELAARLGGESSAELRRAGGFEAV